MNALESFCPSITLILSIPQRQSNLGTKNASQVKIEMSTLHKYIDNTYYMYLI